MTDSTLETSNTLRPVAGAPSELTVSELVELWHRASMRYMLAGYARAYLQAVSNEFKGETKEYIASRAIVDAMQWRDSHINRRLNFTALDDALEAARMWITTAAARPRGTDPEQHKARRDAIWAFNAVATTSIVELVREVCQ